MPGPVYDLDYVRNVGWVQVLADGLAPGPALVTKSAACASALAAAYASGRDSQFVAGPASATEIAFVEILPTILPTQTAGKWAIGRVRLTV